MTVADPLSELANLLVDPEIEGRKEKRVKLIPPSVRLAEQLNAIIDGAVEFSDGKYPVNLGCSCGWSTTVGSDDELRRAFRKHVDVAGHENLPEIRQPRKVRRRARA